MTPQRRPCTVEVSDLAPVSAAQVWATIADPRSFAAWVCGTREIRDADPTWPAPGSSLNHRWGVWPLRASDSTTITDCRPLERLDLFARVGRIARVQISIRLQDEGEMTRIHLTETILAGLTVRFGPLTRGIQVWRNRRSLAALCRLSRERGVR